MKLLLVEESADVLLIEKLFLSSVPGISLAVARSGEQAWEMVRQTYYPIVISDWIMPGMSGLELCRKIRTLPEYEICYFILITSLDQIKFLVEGRQAGADDVIIKPLYKDLFNIRVEAGKRVVLAAQRIQEQNAKLSHILDEINADLEAAKQLQHSVLPPPQRIGDINIAWFYRPNIQLGGDTFGYWKVSETAVFFYQLDVSGHGISASLVSFSLSNSLRTRFSQKVSQGMLQTDDWGEILQKLLEDINRRYLSEGDTAHYFTMICGIADTKRNTLVFNQAGHTSPILIKKTGEMVKLESKGFPLGLLEHVSYDNIYQQDWQPGDQLLVYSDGVVDIPTQDAPSLSFAQFSEVLTSTPRVPDTQQIAVDDLLEALLARCHNASPKDDMALLSLYHAGS